MDENSLNILEEIELKLRDIILNLEKIKAKPIRRIELNVQQNSGGRSPEFCD